EVAPAAIASALSVQAASAAPALLISATLRAATTGPASATVAALAQGVLRTMILNKLERGALVLLFVLGLSGAGYMAYPTAQPPVNPAAPAAQVAAVPAIEVTRIEAAGALVPSNSTWVYPPLDGTVQAWHCKSGMEVRKGQKIVTVSSPDAEQKLAELHAEIHKGSIMVEVLKQTPQTDRDAVIKLVEVQAMLDNKRKELAVLHKMYQGGDIEAPIDGTVIIADPHEWLGKAVTPRDPIFRVARVNEAWHADLWFAEGDVGLLL